MSDKLQFVAICSTLVNDKLKFVEHQSSTRTITHFK